MAARGFLGPQDPHFLDQARGVDRVVDEETPAGQAARHDRHVVGVADPRPWGEPGGHAVDLDLGRDADDDRPAQRVLREGALHLRCCRGREASGDREGGDETKHGWMTKCDGRAIAA